MNTLKIITQGFTFIVEKNGLRVEYLHVFKHIYDIDIKEENLSLGR